MSASTDSSNWPGMRSDAARAGGLAATNDAAQIATPAPQGPPVVSVVVVADVELDRLDCNLDALARQDMQMPYEVLIVDDEPDPAASRLVCAWAARRTGHHAMLRYLPNTTGRHGLAAARNLGWHAASAPIIAFTDADTVPASDWLRQGLAAFERPGVAPPPQGTPSDRWQQAESAGAGAANCLDRTDNPDRADSADSADSADNADKAGTAQPMAGADEVGAVFGKVDARLPRHPTEHQVDTWLRDSADFSPRNWFCRRAVLAAVGGFDERFGELPGEADDLHLRLLESAVPCSCDPAVLVVHPLLADNWGASLSHLRRLGSESLLLKRHPRRYRERIHQGIAPILPLPLWHDLAVVAVLLLTALGMSLHHEVLTVAAGGTWLVLTAMLIIRRLLDTAKTPGHIAEVMLTSLVMPVLALFWRLTGALRYRMQFARP